MSDLDKLKQLRAETGVSYSVCQKALADAKGNMDKALDILREKGAEVAKKKAERETKQGSVFTYLHHNKKIGAMITLLCETDFVARNDSFVEVGNDIAMQVASTDPSSIKTLLKEDFIKDQKQTIDGLIKDLILKLGENISIGEMARFEI